MEEEQQLTQTRPPPLLHPNTHKKVRFVIKFLNSPAAYVILLLLAYALGYLSAPYTHSSTRLLSSSSSTTEFVNTNNNNNNNRLVSKLNNNLPTQLDNFRVTTHCADPLPPNLVRETILHRIYNATSPYDNFPPAHISHRLRSVKLRGWGSYGAVFENLIRKVKPRVIIEVGTFLGASALHMAELTRQLGLDSSIVCIDDFRGWPGFRDKFGFVDMVNGDILLLYQFMKNVIYRNATDRVLPVPFSSGSALEKLCEWGILGDLIEIDAGHDFNSAWADINRAYRILRPDGVIFGHDYFTAKDNKGVRRAVNLFAQLNGLQIQTDGQHWVIDTAVRNHARKSTAS